VDILLLRLEAPVMSFGTTSLDDFGATDHFPQRSMLVGIIGNALGLDFADTSMLDGLQERVRYAVRCDHKGHIVEDFQTVDTRQPFMQGATLTAYGWTSFRGSQHKTLRRWRQYVADGNYLVAVTLVSPNVSPTLDEVSMSLQQPCRPLFIGRKCCLPSSPLFESRVGATNLVSALRLVPSKDARLLARWPLDEEPEGQRILTLTEDRDWANGVHVGERFMKEGWLELTPPAKAEGS
jgi:CRISPR system Cascade subunit CasD